MLADCEALVLAAGLGERMRPLTNWRPKPLLPLFGKAPLTLCMQQLLAAGFTRVLFNTHCLQPYFSDWQAQWPLPLRSEEVFEPTLLGTGGTLKALRGRLQTDFLLLNSDVVSDCNLAALLATHRHQGNLVTLAASPSDQLAAPLFVNPEHRLLGLWDRRPSSASGYRADYIGIAAINTALCEYLTDSTPQCWIRHGLQPALTAKQPIGVFVHSGYWRDIGTPASFYALHEELWASPRLQQRLYVPITSSTVANAAWQTAPVWLDTGVHLAAGVRLGPGAFVGAAAVLGTDVQIRHSVVLPGVVLPPGMTLDHGIVAPWHPPLVF